MEWNHFIWTENGENLDVRWVGTEYVMELPTEYGVLKYGLHIMCMCPKRYTEEMLRKNYCHESYMNLKAAESFLKNSGDRIQELKEKRNVLKKKYAREMAPLMAEKERLRKNRNSGLITEAEFTSFIKKFNIERKEISSRIEGEFRTYSRAFWSSVPENARSPLSDFLGPDFSSL